MQGVKLFHLTLFGFPLYFPSTPRLDVHPSIVNQRLEGLQELHEEERKPWSLIRVELRRVRSCNRP